MKNSHWIKCGLATLSVIAAGCSPDTGHVFGGTITNTKGELVANANIQIGGVSARSDKAGRFKLIAPKKDRWVMNVRHSDYAEWSQVVTYPNSAQNISMVRVSKHVIDPKKDNVLKDKRVPSDCPGLSTAVKELPKLDCGEGIEVSIPANSLVDRNGELPSKDVTISLATYDITAQQQMPGDRLVSKEGGKAAIGVMTSFGAGYIGASMGETELFPRKGGRIEVEIPLAPGVQASQSTQVPSTIPFLTFNMDSGFWEQTDQAQRTDTGFVAAVSNFAPINADQVGGPWGCLRVYIGGEVLQTEPPNNLRLDVRVGANPVPDSADTVFTQVIPDFMSTNTGPWAIYALLVGQYVTVTPYNDATGAPVGISALGPIQISAPQSPQNPNPPAANYSACSDTLNITMSWPG